MIARSLQDLRSLISEHTQLVDSLESRDDTKLKAELAKQKEELAEYKATADLGAADPAYPNIQKFMRKYAR